MTALTEEAVRGALEGVVDPTFDKPMLAIGTLRDVGVAGEVVRVTAQLASPSETVRETVRARVRAESGHTLTWEIVRIGVPLDGRPTGEALAREATLS